MDVWYDLHTHTTYSDGWDWREMVETAEAAGLTAIGFTDHCPVVSDKFGRRDRYDFVDTYEERRREFAEGEPSDIRIFDGAEINYDPRYEDEIGAFLDRADFSYTIGSVHFAGEYDVSHPDLADADEETRREAITKYVDWQVSLIESGLFEIIGHLDVTQRDPQLRDVITREEYVRLADALAGSETVPELNAGRLDREYGTVHPHPDHLEPFADREIPFVIGTDSHAPDQLTKRIRRLRELLPELSIEIADPSAIVTHKS